MLASATQGVAQIRRRQAVSLNVSASANQLCCSGHYRPTTKSFKVFIDSLKRQNVDMSKLKISNAYAVLLGMEYYGRTKSGLGHLVPHRHHDDNGKCRSSVVLEKDTLTADNTQAHKHRSGLRKLMDDLHIRRRSTEVKRGPVGA